jgi:hypothetical protein
MSVHRNLPENIDPYVPGGYLQAKQAKTWASNHPGLIIKSPEEDDNAAAKPEVKGLRIESNARSKPTGRNTNTIKKETGSEYNDWWRRSSICNDDQRPDAVTDEASDCTAGHSELAAERRRAVSSSDHEANPPGQSGVVTDSDNGTTIQGNDVLDITTPTRPHGVKGLQSSVVYGSTNGDDLDPKPQNMSRGHPEVCEYVGQMEPDAAVVPSAAPVATSIFAEAREDLKCLRKDIEELQDSSEGSESGSETSFEVQHLPYRDCGVVNDNSLYPCHGWSAEQGGDQRDFCAGTVQLQGTGSSSVQPTAQSQSNKRSQISDSSENSTLTAIKPSLKKAKCERFVCCFKDDPDQPCPGTDATLGAVIKSLADKHHIYICSICYVLGAKDELSGDFVHPDNNQLCQPHCLSPRCFKTGLTIEQRHLFNQRTCGKGNRKTSRINSEDSEPAVRFIFHLARPTQHQMESILTSDNSVHNNTKRRKSNRGPTKEALQKRVEDLDRRVGEGEEHNIAKTARIRQLEQELATERSRVAAEGKRVFELETLQSRIFLLLGDALRKGTFTDQADYDSLRKRENDCVQTADSLKPQSLPTPPTSNSSQRSSTTPIRDDANVSRGDQATQDAFGQDACHDASLQSSYDSGSEHNAAQADVIGRDLNLHNTDDVMGDKLIPGSSTAQSICASGHEISSADPGSTKDPQEVDIGVEGTPPMSWDPASTDLQFSMSGAASGQGEGDALQFQNFDEGIFDYDGFDARYY